MSTKIILSFYKTNYKQIYRWGFESIIDKYDAKMKTEEARDIDIASRYLLMN